MTPELAPISRKLSVTAREVAWNCPKCPVEVVIERLDGALTPNNRKAVAMHLPIDTSNIRFTCTRAPERRTMRETGQPRIDRETGRETVAGPSHGLDPRWRGHPGDHGAR